MNVEKYHYYSQHSLMHQIKQDYVASHQGQLIPRSTLKGWLIYHVDRACKKLGLSKWKVLNGNLRLREAVNHVLPSLPQASEHSQKIIQKLEDELTWNQEELKTAAAWLFEKLFPGESLSPRIDQALLANKRSVASKEIAVLFKQKLQAYLREPATLNDPEIPYSMTKALPVLRTLIEIDERQLKQAGISPEAFKRVMIGCYDGLDYNPGNGSTGDMTVLRLFKYIDRNLYPQSPENSDSLEECKITPYSFQCLLTHFANPLYSHRGGFVFRGLGLTNEHALMMGAYLRHCSSNFKNLILSNNRIDDEGIKEIAQSLKDHSLSLSTVEINRLETGPQAALILAEICQLGLVQRLTLANCPLGSSDCATLLEAMPDPKCQLDFLSLPQVTIDDHFCNSLKQALQENRSLHTLELNLASGENIQELAQALASAREPLDMVKIKIDEKIDEEQLFEFIQNIEGRIANLTLELANPDTQLSLSFANRLIDQMSSYSGVHLTINQPVESVEELKDRGELHSNIFNFPRVPPQINALLAGDKFLILR